MLRLQRGAWSTVAKLLIRKATNENALCPPLPPPLRRQTPGMLSPRCTACRLDVGLVSVKRSSRAVEGRTSCFLCVSEAPNLLRRGSILTPSRAKKQSYFWASKF